MSRGFVLEPKEDITAFELASILIIVQSTKDWNAVREYIKVKCPDAIRHIPGWAWSEPELAEIEHHRESLK